VSPLTPRRARILFAHGSRDPLWKAPIEAVARRVADLSPEAPVVCAYLELMEPDLPGCVETLLQQGHTDLEIVPMFFGVGRHLREDLPGIVQEIRGRHPEATITLQPAIGEDPDVIDLLARRLLAR
jgi:sirohydrochlorin cobaltochelatase